MPRTGAHPRIEPMTSAHAADVLAIYQAGIEEGNATFETRAPDWAGFTATRLPAHRYVATAEGQVAGWVAASAVSSRCVYAGVVEHSVYVHPAARGRGIGRHHGRWRDVILIERRSPALLPAPGQDRPQQPHAEHQPGHAGGHGHRRHPPDRRIGRQHADDHEGIQRGCTDATGRARPSGGPVPGRTRGRG